MCLGAGSRRVFESLGYHAADFQLLPPGIQAETYTPGGPKSATPSMVLVGRIMQYKRVDLAIRALAELHPEMPSLRLHILGPDPAGLRETLEALARRLGVGDVVLFHGRVPDDTKRALLRSAWVNLVPSDQEGWGLTVMEAAACGTPSVGSDISGLSDALVPGVTGATFHQGDALDLARTLRTVLADEEGRRGDGNRRPQVRGDDDLGEPPGPVGDGPGPGPRRAAWTSVALPGGRRPATRCSVSDAGTAGEAGPR